MMSIVLTVVLFSVASIGLVVLWNRNFKPVPPQYALVLWLICSTYQATTLFSGRVDMPGQLAFVAYPWQATGHKPVKANTGIVFTQIAPWTRVARDVLLSGKMPLWNRMSASGTPLLANQQTAIFHPFTLLGLCLPVGKAFTLSASLRLFFVAFFSFVLFRNWGIGDDAAAFGAIAYTFSTFHVVWLLFPLGLATMMLPLCIVGVQEFVRHRRLASYILILIGLSSAVLGGHPESALWVWIVTVLIAIYATAVVPSKSFAERLQFLAVIASAFLLSMLLTAFWWYPTLNLLPETERYGAMRSPAANPADHGLSSEWLLPLITPNVLGTPVNGTYAPPRGFHPAVLNDYGEVASSYAGLLTLGFALAAPFVARRRETVLAFGLMAFSVLTFAEAPGWRDLIRAIPLVGISIHQRLRVVWDLGVCIAAALALDAPIRSSRRRIAACVVLIGAGFALVYALRKPDALRTPLGLAQFVVPVCTLAVAMTLFRSDRRFRVGASFLVLADLLTATYRYNPATTPDKLYPVTPAIRTLQSARQPYRFAAMGWSFLPDTPSYYGIEDIKTTDPLAHARYMRLMRGYLNVEPGSYDQVIGDTTQPFFDYLNVRFVYVPPGASVSGRFQKIYEGPDGVVAENRSALPRYFFARQFTVEPDFGKTVWLSKGIRDFRSEAIVDHIPEKVRRRAPGLNQGTVATAGGEVQLRKYENNAAVLDVHSRGWNLLVTSDVSWRGWRAYWNGQRQPPVIVNGAFVGCFIPPGRGTVKLSYAPDGYSKGMRVSVAALVLFLAFASMIAWRGRRRNHAVAHRSA
jgi:hypothetical protein